jgi:hypothetical protein
LIGCLKQLNAINNNLQDHTIGALANNFLASPDVQYTGSGCSCANSVLRCLCAAGGALSDSSSDVAFHFLVWRRTVTFSEGHL